MLAYQGCRRDTQDVGILESREIKEAERVHPVSFVRTKTLMLRTTKEKNVTVEKPSSTLKD
jgi:hypothetical protein